MIRKMIYTVQASFLFVLGIIQLLHIHDGFYGEMAGIHVSLGFALVVFSSMITDGLIRSEIGVK